MQHPVRAQFLRLSSTTLRTTPVLDLFVPPLECSVDPS